MNKRSRIYVALIDEDVEVWRPIEAEKIDGVDNGYLIVNQPYDPEIEKWQFEPGERVLASLVESSDGQILAATQRLG